MQVSEVMTPYFSKPLDLFLYLTLFSDFVDASYSCK